MTVSTNMLVLCCVLHVCCAKSWRSECIITGAQEEEKLLAAESEEGLCTITRMFYKTMQQNSWWTTYARLCTLATAVTPNATSLCGMHVPNVSCSAPTM